MLKSKTHFDGLLFGQPNFAAAAASANYDDDDDYDDWRPPSVCSRVVAFDYTVLMTGNNSEPQLRARSIVGQLALFAAN